MKHCVLALVLSATLTGCMPAYRVEQARDDFSQQATAAMKGNFLPAGWRSHNWLELNAATMTKAGRPRHVLEVVYYDANAPLEFGSAPRLLVAADSMLIELTAPRPSRADRSSFRSAWRQNLQFGITGTQLQQIAAASRVRLRLVGRREYVERELNTENRERLRKFVER